MKKLFAIAIVAATAFSCAKEGGEIESLRITSGEYFEIYVGHTLSLDVELVPASADLSKVAWTSDKPSVATVTSGFVTGVSAGEAVITASCGEASASVSVSVKDVNVTSFSISDPGKTAPGETVEIPVTDIQPDFADARNIHWSLVDSGNAEYFSIVEVQPDRVLVKAADDAADGYWCELYGKNNDNSFRRSVTVTVIYKALKSLSLPSSLSIPTGDSKEVTCTMTPSVLTTPVELQWTSSDPSTVSVEGSGTSATIRALKETTSPVSITVKDTYTGKSATCKVTVTFKRVIKSDAKVGFYKTITEVVKSGTTLYRVSDQVSTSSTTFLPYTASDNLYVGLDDGYALSEGELDVTLTLGGSMSTKECSRFHGTKPYRIYAVIYDNGASGSFTVRIPNGSTATANFTTAISSFSMEKAGTNGFTGFSSGYTTTSVGGTFTITRPAQNKTDRYRFCVNSGSRPVNATDYESISGPCSKDCWIAGWTCAELESAGVEYDHQIEVKSTTPTGTYTFTNTYSYYPCYNGLTFKVIIK